MLGSSLLPKSDDELLTLDDYQSSIPRWCTGCGDLGILTALQRLCRDEDLPREKTVFVSGIGCSSRFPHYMNTYLSLIHISEPTRLDLASRMPSSA